MAMKPNYNFEKRQRELAKKKQKEEKLQRKRAKNAPAAGDEAGGDPDATPADDAVNPSS